MRKFAVAVATTALALALAGAACGSQSSTTTRTTVIAAPAAAVSWAGPVNPPSARSTVGTWGGYITPFPSSGATSRRRLTIVVARGERTGTWRIGLRCAGTLRLKDISSGYHHYYRVAGANSGCAALGVDCLKRVGAQMVDEFVPNSGPEDSVNLRRVR